MCPYIFMSAHSSICVHLGARNRHYVSSPSFSNFNLETGSPSTCSSPISLVWLASKLQGSVCLLLPAMSCQSGFLKSYSFFFNFNFILFISFTYRPSFPSLISSPYSSPSTPLFPSPFRKGQTSDGLEQSISQDFLGGL